MIDLRTQKVPAFYIASLRDFRTEIWSLYRKKNEPNFHVLYFWRTSHDMKCGESSESTTMTTTLTMIVRGRVKMLVLETDARQCILYN